MVFGAELLYGAPHVSANACGRGFRPRTRKLAAGKQRPLLANEQVTGGQYMGGESYAGTGSCSL